MKELSVCRFCSKSFKPDKSSKGHYCSVTHYVQDKSNVVYKKFLCGKVKHRDTLYKCLVIRDGDACAVAGCQVSVNWLGSKIRLQVDHVDGNPGNHEASNLRLICPNCHSQTATFGARNKGFGRKSRGLPRR